MAKLDRQARRLHPKLRMFDNGSMSVNSTRSDISILVACSSKEPADEEGKQLVEIDMAGAQQDLLNLRMEVPGLLKQRLPKRAKLAEEKLADDAYVNVTIEVAPGTDGDTAAAVQRLAASCRGWLEKANRDVIHGAVVERGGLIAATVPIAALAELESDRDVAFVFPPEPLKLEVPAPERASRPTPRRVGAKRIRDRSDEVILGIIDVGGFDFSHPDFLDDDGNSRFLSIWDQGGDFRPPPADFDSDAKFDYGAEFRKEHLDRALADSRHPGALPANLLEPQSQRFEGSHGTHVASIAAGNRGVCPKADIAAVVVSIPPQEDERERRRFTFSDSSRIVHAVEYLMEVARRRGKPIAINVSLGTNGGAHDGSSGASRWLDASLTVPGTAICVAAGNAGQEAPTSEQDLGWMMGRIHTSGRVAARGLNVDLEWVVVGNGIADISENELEIWYGAQDRLIAMVQPPGQDRWLTVKPQEFIENKRLRNGTTVSIYNELYHPANGANYISIYLSPNLQPGHIRGVQAGVWRVRLRGEDIRDGSFHAWIERDDPQDVGRSGDMRLFRFPSFFSSMTSVDSHSISSLACGHNVIAVANLSSETELINVTSSQGPTRDKRLKPDIAAPGTAIVAAKGFALDGRDWVAMTGTSMASPFAAGVIGLMLVANPDLTAAQCIGILQRTAQPLPGSSFEWKNDTGFGRIDATAAIKEAETFGQRVEK